LNNRDLGNDEIREGDIAENYKNSGYIKESNNIKQF